MKTRSEYASVCRVLALDASNWSAKGKHKSQKYSTLFAKRSAQSPARALISVNLLINRCHPVRLSRSLSIRDRVLLRNHISCSKVTAPSPSNNGYRSKRGQAPVTLSVLFGSAARNACMRACLRACVRDSLRYLTNFTTSTSNLGLESHISLSLFIIWLSKRCWMRACQWRFLCRVIKARVHAIS